MSEVKKLTTEELQAIKDMQSRYNKHAFELGSLEIQLSGIEKTKQLLHKEKELILEDIKKLGEKAVTITSRSRRTGLLPSSPEVRRHRP